MRTGTAAERAGPAENGTAVHVSRAGRPRPAGAAPAGRTAPVAEPGHLSSAPSLARVDRAFRGRGPRQCLDPLGGEEFRDGRADLGAHRDARGEDPLRLQAVHDGGEPDTVRREYRAVGITLGLHPQIDLAADPRRVRAGGTYGQDAEITKRPALAYVRGLQGEKPGPGSVAAMGRHFPGGGPQKDGEDHGAGRPRKRLGTAPSADDRPPVRCRASARPSSPPRRRSPRR
jgi:hypothetical protein